MTPPSRSTVPLVVAALVVVVSALVTGARSLAVCESDVACLVLAGDRFTDSEQADLPVVDGDGYDAQFFYRQSRSPLDLEMSASNGVRFDTPARAGRIGYPLMVWALSAGGQPAAVPWAMVAVGVLSMGAIGYVLSAAAAQAGRSPWWGAAASAIPGLWFAASRALADPFSAALIGGAALALTRRRWGVAASLFAVATLTKEQAVIVPLAYGLVRLWQAWSTGPRRLDPIGVDLPWIAPGVVFIGWQLAVAAATGSVPAAEAGGSNVAGPLVELVPAVWGWLSPAGASEVLWLLELVVFVALAVLVVAAPSAFGWERMVAGVALVFVLSFNDNVFVDPAHFRQVGDLTVVLLIAAFRTPKKWWVPMVGANATVTAGVIGRVLSGL